MIMILAILFVYSIVFCIYFASPLPLRILIMIINSLVPDSIPVVDEVIMLSGIVSKFTLVSDISDCLDRIEQWIYSVTGIYVSHKKIIVIGVFIVLMFVLLVL